MLTKKQFDILVNLLDGNYSQRELEEKTGYSLGTVNKVLKELKTDGLLENNAPTQKAMDILESYKAKRAVFIAAGFGSRLVPITLNTPDRKSVV